MDTTKEYLVAAAMRKVHMLGQGSTPTTDEQTEAVYQLDGLLSTLNSIPSIEYFMSSTPVAVTTTTANYVELDETVLWVESATCVNGTDKYKLKPMPMSEYLAHPMKDISGAPLKFAVTTDIIGSASTKKRMYLWPKPTTSTITYSYRRKIILFGTTSINLDLPDTWVEFVITKLAYKLAYEYGKIELLQPLIAEINGITAILMPDASADPQGATPVAV